MKTNGEVDILSYLHASPEKKNKESEAQAFSELRNGVTRMFANLFPFAGFCGLPRIGDSCRYRKKYQVSIFEKLFNASDITTTHPPKIIIISHLNFSSTIVDLNPNKSVRNAGSVAGREENLVF